MHSRVCAAPVAVLPALAAARERHQRLCCCRCASDWSPGHAGICGSRRRVDVLQQLRNSLTPGERRLHSRREAAVSSETSSQLRGTTPSIEAGCCFASLCAQASALHSERGGGVTGSTQSPKQPLAQAHLASAGCTGGLAGVSRPALGHLQGRHTGGTHTPDEQQRHTTTGEMVVREGGRREEAPDRSAPRSCDHNMVAGDHSILCGACLAHPRPLPV